MDVVNIVQSMRILKVGILLTRYLAGERGGDWLHPTKNRHGTRTTRRANARVPRCSVPAAVEKFEMTQAGLHQELR